MKFFTIFVEFSDVSRRDSNVEWLNVQYFSYSMNLPIFVHLFVEIIHSALWGIWHLLHRENRVLKRVQAFPSSNLVPPNTTNDCILTWNFSLNNKEKMYISVYDPTQYPYQWQDNQTKQNASDYVIISPGHLFCEWPLAYWHSVRSSLLLVFLQ